MRARRETGATRETACEALKPAYIFREMSDNNVVIPIRGKEPEEYLYELHSAICHAKLLIFERRGLDLGEEESHAPYVLTDLQMKIVQRE